MNLKRIEQYLDNLKPGERDHALNHLIGITAQSAAVMSKQYDLKLVSDYWDEILDRNANWNKPVGLPVGLPTLDKFTMGLAPGELIVIGGATSHGKTLLACNITARLASAGHRILFVTLEMTHAELGSRLLRIMGTDQEPQSANIAFQAAEQLDWQAIDGLIARAVKQFGAELVVIDHLHYFTRELQNVAEDLGRITREFKKNAIHHKIPIILISHTRKSEKNQRTTIDDLRGSSYIAQDADIVLMVSRKNEAPDRLYVTLEKNRNRYGVQIGSEAAEALFLLDRDRLRLDDPQDGPFPGAITSIPSQ
jgi:replicative DNA helicase